MASTFGGLETAVRGLRTSQIALETTGHNIANVDTEGFSRQRVESTAADPYTYPSLNNTTWAGQVGTGSEVTAIRRLRDDFIDYQMRGSLSTQGKWASRQENLEQLEVIFNEPSDSGISEQLSKFWDALQELANTPDISSVRASMRETAIALTDTIKLTYEQLEELQGDLNSEVGVIVAQVNTLAKEIAELNANIAKVKGIGQSPNDLMDQRELLVQDLAKIVDVGITTDNTGQYHISVGGSLLVAGDNTMSMKVVRNMDNHGYNDIVWETTGAKVNISNGELAGILEMRDKELPYYMDKMNEFTSTLISKFNAIHQSGFGLDNSTNVSFFSGTDARDIGIDTNIMINLNNIAASGNVAGPTETPTGAEGNGDNALALSRLLNSDLVMENGKASIVDFYDGIITKLGVEAEKANNTTANQETLVNYLQERQNSVSGVNLDEELANMLKYENAYKASSRFLTAFDEMLDTLIQSTGVVGR